jgi:hypothetical protein
MQIRRVGAELFHADRHMGRHDGGKKFSFLNFFERAQKRERLMRHVKC